jgi:drug/metabolite transporter (DMT)-like permease
MLGAYSLLIKSVKTSLSTQLLARMATYTAGSIVLGTYFQRLPSISLSHLLSMGVLNTTHVASSYYAFKELSTPVSLSLFYIYPIFNIIFSSVFLNEKIPISTLPWIALAFIGSLFIIFPEKLEVDKQKTAGYVSIIIAAITESLIYVAVRSKYEITEMQGTFHLYAGGLIATLLGRVFNVIEPFDFNIDVWKQLLPFNLLIGFLGLLGVFISIPKIPVEVFATLSFFGVLSGFIFGELGGETRPTLNTYIGAGAITSAAIALRLISGIR